MPGPFNLNSPCGTSQSPSKIIRPNVPALLRAYLLVRLRGMGVIARNVGLATNFPRREFGDGEDDLTLEEAGLAPRAGQKVRLHRTSPLLCGGLASPSLSQSHRANHLPQIVHGQPKGGPPAVDAMRQREMFSGAEVIFQTHARVAHVEQNIVVSL